MAGQITEDRLGTGATSQRRWAEAQDGPAAAAGNDIDLELDGQTIERGAAGSLVNLLRDAEKNNNKLAWPARCVCKLSRIGLAPLLCFCLQSHYLSVYVF